VLSGQRHRLLAILALCITASSVTAEPVTLTTLQGESVEIDLQEIDDQGRLIASGSARPISLDSLISFQTGAAPAPVEAKLVVELLSGGRLMAEQAVYADEQFAITRPGGGEWKLPIDSVQGVRFRPGWKDAAFEAALAKPSEEADRLYVELAENQFQTLDGLLESITAEQIVFNWKGESRTVPRGKVAGLAVAQVIDGEQPPAVVTLADGSIVAGKIESFRQGVLKMKLPGGAKLNLPWGQVVGAALRSSKLAYLSDFKEVEQSHAPLVTAEQPARRDLSVGGGPITLGKQQYAKGWGVHASSELIFDLRGRYDQFLAVIGIDAETQGQGDCLFRVLLDGKELLSQRMKATDPAKSIQLKITGGKTLTLSVEPGADLDLADHADWAAARVLQE